MFLNELLPDNARNGLRIQGKPKAMSDAEFKNARRVMMNLVKHHDVIMRLIEDAAFDCKDDNEMAALGQIHKDLSL
ncbi:hypothetical protein phiAS5_ORF0277 [Aeromonas phage phiAS5]|uniref:Uncharacterized protein n=1 Tax=Aeromonas phage phiAS5 TaxID=879630 RepID=E1A231_9CAUD|nr:hypothetical protein phiAS5_ORF0277 [Aeromonas phage phiAS5]ADM80120.1 hypothetical protein phiAS5_ORF0277 [Aeromonas phage phiAS5]BES53117.1 hypothetical protein [Aeromonas phage phiWae14]